MLAQTVSLEAPDLEEKKKMLVTGNAAMNRELKNIEDKILKLLSESKGDILDDVELINVLAEAKKAGNEINQKAAEAKIIEKEIDVKRAS